MKKKSQTTAKKDKLAKVLAHAGIASRRAAEALILDGRVSVNGAVEKNVARTVDPEIDVVEYQGKPVVAEMHVYYVLNKPVGYTSTVSDTHAEKVVTSLVPKRPRVYPVGRLDKDSEGLLILTNDGEFTNRMTHPRFEQEKVYDVTLRDAVSYDLIDKLKKGVMLEEGLAQADSVKKLSTDRLRITIHQGWNRQIRRMVGAAGGVVTQLVRIKEGTVSLGSLAPGEYKKISKPE